MSSLALADDVANDRIDRLTAADWHFANAKTQLARDSGTLRGKRTVWGGRAPVRAVLYMRILVATRRHPVIRAFYGRLVTAGKPKNVARIACMQAGSRSSTP